jgi:hypothetical protein
MKVELGKCYKDKQGRIIGPIGYSSYPFANYDGEEYAEDGEHKDYMVDTPGEQDLVEEYVEPARAETWAAITKDGIVFRTSDNKKYLEENYIECRVVKMVEQREAE